MTSQSDLPIAEFGMIWDKETEFARLIPGHPGNYYPVSLATDGSRQVVDFGIVSDVTGAFITAINRGWEVVGLASELIDH